jgi:hypothetical protein
MRMQRKLVLIIALFAVLFAIRRTLGSAFAQGRPAAVGTQVKQLLSNDQVKLLFLLMDTDKDGKISKQEWMTFMAAEFDRLDQNKNGELDARELSQLTLPGITFASAGK